MVVGELEKDSDRAQEKFRQSGYFNGDGEWIYKRMRDRDPHLADLWREWYFEKAESPYTFTFNNSRPGSRANSPAESCKASSSP